MKKQRTPFVSDIELSYKPTAYLKGQTHIQHSSDAAPLCRSLIPEGQIVLREYFIMLLLNRSNRVMGRSIISIGGVNITVADPKIIFMTALAGAASGFILAHNHPSGILAPSQNDIQLTKRLQEGARILEITLLDHIIIGPDTDAYFSFADEGLL